MTEKFLGFIDKRPKIIAHYFILSAFLFPGFFIIQIILDILKILNSSVQGYFWMFLFWAFWLMFVDGITHTYIIKED